MSDNPEHEFKALSEKLKGAITTVEQSRDSVMSEMKNLGKTSDETKAKADQAIAEMKSITDKVAAAEKKMTETTDRLTDLEQKAARRPGGGEPEVKSLGQRFVEDDKVKTFLGTSDRRGLVNVSAERKNITSATTTVGTGTSPSNSLIVADRQAFVGLPMRPRVVRDLLSPGNTTSNNIEYPVMTSRTQNAAPVAETALKPQSDLQFDLKSAPVRTLAHWFKASRQILDDAPALSSMIDAEARYGLEFLEDIQFLYGDGTGQNLNGIIPQASAYGAPGSFAIPGETAIDRIRLAILQATLALYPATGIVLNPTDWARIETIKDGQGRYIVGNPFGQIAPTLWGLPVAVSLAMTAGTFLVGAFRRGAQIFDRMAIEVLLSTEDQDNFVKNMVTIRAEERLALAVYRPSAFVTGALP